GPVTLPLPTLTTQDAYFEINFNSVIRPRFVRRSGWGERIDLPDECTTVRLGRARGGNRPRPTTVESRANREGECMESRSVYDRIREKIVRNDLRPGTKINIDALVRELGVSQTPVREALHHLEGDGLVERVKGRGYSTTALLDGVEFRHMFEVRMLLEPWSARVLSSDRMTNPGDELVRLVDDFRASGEVSRTHLA